MHSDCLWHLTHSSHHQLPRLHHADCGHVRSILYFEPLSPTNSVCCHQLLTQLKLSPEKGQPPSFYLQPSTAQIENYQLVSLPLFPIEIAQHTALNPVSEFLLNNDLHDPSPSGLKLGYINRNAAKGERCICYCHYCRVLLLLALYVLLKCGEEYSVAPQNLLSTGSFSISSPRSIKVLWKE